jgi:hypothetical protein
MRSQPSLVAGIAILVLGSFSSAAEIRGVIRSVDPGKQELTVEGRGRGMRGLRMVLATDKDTQILIGTKPGAFADLAAGKRARIEYEVRDGMPVARSIKVVSLQIELPPPAPVGPSAVNDANTVSGTLRRVAQTEREIVVIGAAEKETTIAVPDNVQVVRGQKLIHFEDLHEGESAVVHTERQDGRLAAKSIEAGTLVSANPPNRDRRIERLRQILKTIDGLLEMAEKRRSDNP